jgi:hypothetical protein
LLSYIPVYTFDTSNQLNASHPMAHKIFDIDKEASLIYTDLTVHQRINIKSKVGVHYTKTIMERVTKHHPWMYGSPYQMPIKTGKGYSI